MAIAVIVQAVQFIGNMIDLIAQVAKVRPAHILVVMVIAHPALLEANPAQLTFKVAILTAAQRAAVVSMVDTIGQPVDAVVEVPTAAAMVTPVIAAPVIVAPVIAARSAPLPRAGLTLLAAALPAGWGLGLRLALGLRVGLRQGGRSDHGAGGQGQQGAGPVHRQYLFDFATGRAPGVSAGEIM